MTFDPSPSDAEALDAYLDGRRAEAAGLPPGEAALADELLSLSRSCRPEEAFTRRLEERLSAASQNQAKPAFTERFHSMGKPTLFKKTALILAGAAALALIWLVGAPLLSPAPPATPSPLPVAANLTPLPAASVQPSPHLSLPGLDVLLAQAASNAGQALQNVTLELKTALPEGPQSVTLYRQLPPTEALTPQSAQAMAARLGVDGNVYSYTGEGGSPTYLVSDGKSTVLFPGSSPLDFTYQLRGSAAAGSQPLSLSFAEQEKIATDWLNARGLLDFAYQAQALPTEPSGVMFVPQLGDTPLYTNNLRDPRIRVQIGADGQVEQVRYAALGTQEVGQYAIRSAADAWQEIQSGALEQKDVFYQVLDFGGQSSLRTWIHAFPNGQPVDLYGYAAITQAVDASQPPYVEVAGVPMQGDTAALARDLGARQFLHVWGLYHSDAQGRAWLELQGWELSSAQEASLHGVIRDGGLLTDQGQQVPLADLPTDIPSDAKVSVAGAQLATGQFWWRVIQTDIQPGSAQSSGAVPLPGSNSAPTQPVQPPQNGYQPGGAIDGLEGTLDDLIYRQPDGSQVLVNQVFVSQTLPDGSLGWSARLIGPGLAGIEAYNRLPLKLWGSYELVDNQPVINVERYEPAIPGAKIEAWFGKVGEASLEGQNVLTLTDDQGQTWVLEHSILFPQSLADFGWQAGADIAVDGYPLPGQSFGGRPVLYDLGASLLGIKGTTRETYKAQSNQPQVLQEQAPADVLPGTASVESVELVYYAFDFHGGPPSALQPDDPAAIIQPLWRFSGHLGDGRAFEILVQAIKG